MTQPPAAPPPGEMTPRTDAGARKLIERIDKIAERLDSRIKATDADVLELKRALNRRMKQKVSYLALLSIVGVGSGTVVKISIDTSNQTRKEMMEARKSIAEDVRQVRSEQAAKIQAIEAKTNGLYNFVIEGKPKATVREEVKTNLTKTQEETPDGGLNTNDRPPKARRANQ